MPFGRRRDAVSTAGTARRQIQPVALAEGTRQTELRDHLAGLMDAAGRVADAIREEGTLATMPVVVDEIDPEAGPLQAKGIQERFCVGRGRTLRHAIYVFVPPAGHGEPDLTAQNHLQALFGEILAFNQYCQRAHLDEALGVALQSPHVPEIVDRILLRSAFFTAFFENLVSSQDAKLAGIAPPSCQTELQNVEKRLLMARDKMLGSSDVRAMPTLAPSWPFVAGELLVEPHRGDYFLNGVYVPASLATELLRAVAQVDGRKMPQVA